MVAICPVAATNVVSAGECRLLAASANADTGRANLAGIHFCPSSQMQMGYLPQKSEFPNEIKHLRANPRYPIGRLWVSEIGNHPVPPMPGSLNTLITGTH